MRGYWLKTLAVLAASVGLARAQAPLPATAPGTSGPRPVERSTLGAGEHVFTSTEGPGAAPPPPAGVYSGVGTGLAVEQIPAPAEAPVGWNERGCGHTPPRAWFHAEYLLWWVREGSLPSLVGTSPTPEVVTNAAEIPIRTLYGREANGLTFDEQSGLRLSGGFYFDDEGLSGLDASWFQLEEGEEGATFVSRGEPILGPTFFDPVIDRDVLMLASLPLIGTGDLAPGLRAARVDVSATNRLWGADVNYRHRMGAFFFADHLDLLVGFRHVHYSEDLLVTARSEPLPGNEGASTIDTRDAFGVENQFYGGQLGLHSRTYLGDLFTIDVIGKVALGGIRHEAQIAGSTTFSGGGLPTETTPGGILAQRTNMGEHTGGDVTFIPELTINAGLNLTPGVRLTFGYNLIYIGKVLRTGPQIDGVDSRSVQALADFDPTAVTSRPAFVPDQWSRFWAQGINAGLMISY